MKQSKISVSPDGKGNARLRIEHGLDTSADSGESAGIYTIVFPPEVREEVIAALIKCR